MLFLIALLPAAASAKAGWRYTSFPVIPSGTALKLSAPTSLKAGSVTLKPVMDVRAGTHLHWGVEQVYLAAVGNKRVLVKYGVGVSDPKVIGAWNKTARGHVLHLKEGETLAAFYAEGFNSSELFELQKQLATPAKNSAWKISILPCAAAAEVVSGGEETPVAPAAAAVTAEPSPIGMQRAGEILKCVGNETIEAAWSTAKGAYEAATWENIKNMPATAALGAWDGLKYAWDNKGAAWDAVSSGASATGRFLKKTWSDPEQAWADASAAIDRTKQAVIATAAQIGKQMAAFFTYSREVQNEILCHFLYEGAKEGALSAALALTGAGAALAGAKLTAMVARFVAKIKPLERLFRLISDAVQLSHEKAAEYVRKGLRGNLTPADESALEKLAGSRMARHDAGAAAGRGMIVTEKRVFSEYRERWATMSAADKAKVTKDLTDSMEGELKTLGFKVTRTKNPDGTSKLLIDEMPGKPGEFYRRVRGVYGDKQAKLVYDPAAMIAEEGGGGAFNRVAHEISTDSVMLKRLAEGDLSALKHELRHGRQAMDEDAGRVNAHHGKLFFADEAPRGGRNYVYGDQVQVDEILTYTKQLPDSTREARAVLKQIEANPQSLRNQETLNRFKATIQEMESNYSHVTTISRGVEESASTIKKHLSPAAKASSKVNEAGNTIHTFRGAGGEPVTFEFLQHESLGKNGVIGVIFPAVRNGNVVRQAGGEVAEDFFTIPVPPEKYTELKNNAQAARDYVLGQVEKNRQAAEAARRQAGEFREREINPLLERLREAGRRGYNGN